MNRKGYYPDDFIVGENYILEIMREGEIIFVRGKVSDTEYDNEGKLCLELLVNSLSKRKGKAPPKTSCRIPYENIAGSSLARV